MFSVLNIDNYGCYWSPNYDSFVSSDSIPVGLV